MKAIRLACVCLTLLVPAFPQRGVPQTGSTASETGATVQKNLRRLKTNLQSPYEPEQVLYAFQDIPDGDGPAGVIFDSSGNLYGTTYRGGSNGNGPCAVPAIGCGTVFELSPNGSGGWTETILYNFQGGDDGMYPNPGLIFDQAGNLYGTTSLGGGGTGYPCSRSQGDGCGTVFELSPNGSGGWTENILYSFQGNTDAFSPSSLIFDASGNLFATTGGYGLGSCSGTACGTVVELTPKAGGGWTETIIYTFQSDGSGPDPGLVFDSTGNLYGATYSAGTASCPSGSFSSGCGTVFELSPNGSGGWTEKILYNFQDNVYDGVFPVTGPIFDQAGNLYGETFMGGIGPCIQLPYHPNGCGTVYELSPNGSGGWTETILYNFLAGPDGNEPAAGLVFGPTGNLYGTTLWGGANCIITLDPCGNGTIFELSPNGSRGWVENILYSFQGGASDGSSPTSDLTLDQAGNLYGTTLDGGGTACSIGCGVVFEVSNEQFATFSPFGLNFANQTTGTTSSPQTLTLTNAGGQLLTVTSIQVTGVNSSDFGQTNNCPPSLTPSSSCSITVTFSPTALGFASALISVTDNATGSPQTIGLTGVGTSANGFVIAPAAGQATSATVGAGQSAKFSLMLSPSGYFTGTVDLSCSITPVVSAAPTCSLPSSLQISGTSGQAVTVTIETTAAATMGTISDGKFPLGWMPLGWTGAVFVSICLLLGRRKRLSVLAVPTIVLTIASWVGCGGGSSSSSSQITTQGTPPGTYTATVTARSGTFSHNLSLTVKVN